MFLSFLIELAFGTVQDPLRKIMHKETQGSAGKSKYNNKLSSKSHGATRASVQRHTTATFTSDDDDDQQPAANH
jgi:hypothetical protein